MNGQDIGAVTIAVVALVQLLKWSGIPPRLAPVVVLIVSALGTGIWAWSAQAASRATAFDLFTGWVLVAVSAAGVFGFVRAAPEALTSFVKE